MTPAQLRAFGRAHARLEAAGRASWMEDARAAVWAKPDDFLACTTSMRRG